MQPLEVGLGLVVRINPQYSHPVFMGYHSNVHATINKMQENTRKNPKALNRVTKCHTMMVQDSFLGSLLVLPVELSKRIVG